MSIVIPKSNRLALVNNNPGNLRLAGQKGATQGEGNFAKFQSPEAGFQALINDIRAKQTGRTRTSLKPTSTIRDFAFVFAPPSENDSEKYARDIAGFLGLDINTPIGEIDTNDFAKAVARKESSTKVDGVFQKPKIVKGKQAGGIDLKNIVPRIEKARQKGFSDTKINLFLSLKDPELGRKIKKARNAGFNDSKIINFLAKTFAGQELKTPSVPIEEAPPQPQQKKPQIQKASERKGLLFGIRKDIQRRGKRFGEALTGTGRNQMLIESILRGTGEVAGAATDILTRTLGASIRAITPDIIEEKTKEVGGAFLKTPIGKKGLQALQKGVEEFEKFRQKNPRTARNLEAVFDISAFVPVGKVTQIGTKKAVRQTGILGRRLERKAIEKITRKKSKFVADLISPVRTKKVRELQVGKTTETGRGIFKRSIIEPELRDIETAKEVMKISKVNEKNTFQQNFNIIQEANEKESISLVNKLRQNDFIFNEKQLLSKLNQAKENLKLNPAIVGDAEKTADKLITEIQRRVRKAPKKGSSLLQVRKDFDEWVRQQKGVNIFDPTRENAFSLSNREIRQTINNFLEERSIVEVQKSLQKQRSLFNALDNIRPKAAREADTAIKRLIQRASDILGIKNKAVQSIATIVGIGGLGAAAAFAPAVAMLGGASIVLTKTGKLVLSPQLRRNLGIILQQIERKTGLLKRDIEMKQLIEQIKKLLK